MDDEYKERIQPANYDEDTSDELESSVVCYQTQSYLEIALFNKARKRTIRILYWVMLNSTISFSIVMASLWPYLRRLDHDVTESYLGWVNAGYSFGQLVASVLFGYWSDKRRAIEPLLLSILLLIVGSGLYGYAEAFGKNGIYVVCVARVILGLSAGNAAVSRSVAAQLSSKEDRARVMALLAVSQSVGFFVGPAFQAASRPIGTDGLYVPSVRLYMNVYTAPCYLIIVLAIFSGILLLMFFQEDFGDVKKKFQRENEKIARTSSYLEPFDFRMVVLLIFVWFSLMSTFTLTETIASPLVMNEYAWSRSKALFYVSIYLSVAGVLALVVFLTVVPLSKRFYERTLVTGGLFVLFIGIILYLPWGPGHPKLLETHYPNGTVIPAVYNGQDGGCPTEYKWCHTTPSLPFPQFIAAAAIGGIGYPMSAVTLNILYSKVIGPFPQGKCMGWLTGVGSLARIVGPLYVTAVYQHYGPRWSFGGIAILNFLALLCLCFSWKRLIPYEERINKKISINSQLIPAV